MEEYNLEQFKEYLKSLEVDQNPFKCPNLRVLPEDVNLQDRIIGERDYHKEDLICLGIAEKNRHALTYHNCKLSGNIRVNKKGELEVGCNWHKRFKIEIKDLVF